MNDPSSRRSFNNTSGASSIYSLIMQAIEDSAYENVIRGGGPFASQMAIIYPDQSYEMIGVVQGNDVVPSGDPDRHAEDQDMKKNYKALVEKLEEIKGQDFKLVMFSSGESCPSCSSKQQELAHDLRSRGLLQGHNAFDVVFGQSYRQAADMANDRGFFDLQYLLAMQLIAGREEADLYAGKHNNIRVDDVHKAKSIASQYAHDVKAIEDVPSGVQDIFKGSDGSVAVLVRGDKIYALGKDERDGGLCFDTAESKAIEAACLKQRSENPDDVATWILKDAKLYTSTREIGPRMLAQGLWSDMLHFVTVEHERQDEWQTQEIPGLSNAEFLDAVNAMGDHSGVLIGPAEYQETLGKTYRLWEDPERIKTLNSDAGTMYNGADGAAPT